MKFFATILLVALVGAATADPILAKATFDNSLINYLLQPSASVAVANDPAISAQCFNYYLPILTDVANSYSVQYQACLTLANQQQTNLTDMATQERSTYAKEAAGICTAYQSCDNMTDTLGFFNCYATVSNQEVSEVYAISNQAVAAATALSQGMQQIQENEDACTNATQRTYVQNTAQTYEQLDTCLQVGLPAAAVTTDAPVETTVAPVETTIAPVETTIAPVETTIAPVVTTVAAVVDNGGNNAVNTP